MLYNTLPEDINKKVHDVCCLGSDIIGNALTAKIEWLKYLKAITVVFHTHQRILTKKLTDEDKIQFNNYYNQGFIKPFNHSIGFKIFKQGDEVLLLPIETILSPQVLNWVNLIYPFDIKFDFNKIEANDLYPTIAFYFKDEEEARTYRQKGVNFFNQRIKDEIKFHQLYESAEEFIGEDKELFIKKTIKDAKSAYKFGVGNCGLMTDLAFLEACYAEHLFPITYLRFYASSDTTRILELNCIALGNWPEPGCIIVAPWNHKNPVFTWDGEITNAFRSFDTCNIICQISVDEKDRIKSELDKKNYSSWMNSEERENNLNAIREYSENFLEYMINPQHPESRNSLSS